MIQVLGFPVDELIPTCATVDVLGVGSFSIVRTLPPIWSPLPTATVWLIQETQNHWYLVQLDVPPDEVEYVGTVVQSL